MRTFRRRGSSPLQRHRDHPVSSLQDQDLLAVNVALLRAEHELVHAGIHIRAATIDPRHQKLAIHADAYVDAICPLSSVTMGTTDGASLSRCWSPERHCSQREPQLRFAHAVNASRARRRRLASTCCAASCALFAQGPFVVGGGGALALACAQSVAALTNSPLIHVCLMWNISNLLNPCRSTPTAPHRGHSSRAGRSISNDV
jgi:hypothetical protein